MRALANARGNAVSAITDAFQVRHIERGVRADRLALRIGGAERRGTQSLLALGWRPVRSAVSIQRRRFGPAQGAAELAEAELTGHGGADAEVPAEYHARRVLFLAQRSRPLWPESWPLGGSCPRRSRPRFWHSSRRAPTAARSNPIISPPRIRRAGRVLGTGVAWDRRAGRLRESRDACGWCREGPERIGSGCFLERATDDDAMLDTRLGHGSNTVVSFMLRRV